MKIENLIVGDLATNCYLLSINEECIIIDPGDEFSKIKKAVKDKKVVGCLLTHFHFDHIGALEEVLSYYDLEINKVKSNNFCFEIIETPGHTSDSKTFYFPKDKIMFTGDFIFNHSIGRTDLGGNDEDMKNSLAKFKQYDDDIILYPGHGPSTILKKEKKLFDLYYN